MTHEQGKSRLEQLLPHRDSMLLLDDVLSLSSMRAEATVRIHPKSSFYIQGLGVPSWVALEYLGQTAALIAGWQLERGEVEPHLGFLLGTRKFESSVEFFRDKDELKLVCEEAAVVGNGLATFRCEGFVDQSEHAVVRCQLSVMRRSLDDVQKSTPTHE